MKNEEKRLRELYWANPSARNIPESRKGEPPDRKNIHWSLLAKVTPGEARNTNGRYLQIRENDETCTHMGHMGEY